MDLFEFANDLQYGQIHLKNDVDTGLQAIIAIHNLKLGPAIGGCRFLEYPSSDLALQDALRLARGMTYKAAISNLSHGGGKAVILRSPDFQPTDRQELFDAYGRFVESLHGQYITCEDSGTNVQDMDIVRQHTSHVLGYNIHAGSSGDPSPVTAFGVRRGIEAAAYFQWKRSDLDGLHVAIQGVGSVGYHLAGELHRLGVQLTVTDLDSDTMQRCALEFGAHTVAPDAIYDVDCDIFAPCALGGAINDATLPRLRCQIVAGAANNQLSEPHHGAALRQRDIVYVPDYAINAGGLINVAQEYRGYDAEAARRTTSDIYDTILTILDRSHHTDLPTNLVANRIVEERLFGRALH